MAPDLMVLFYSILECVKDVDDDNGNSFPKNTKLFHLHKEE